MNPLWSALSTFTLFVQADWPRLSDGAQPVCILVLEQHGLLARGLSAILPRADYCVFVAPATMSSLPLVATCQADLVLLTIERPADWELLRSIRDQSNVPLIACASHPSRADVTRGLRHGADDFIHLPVTSEELSARILARLRRATWAASDC